MGRDKLMKEIVVLSGKGGTGKTTVTASLAYWLEDKILVDADVDASNLPLVLSPKVKENEGFKAGFEVLKVEELCTSCGLCLEKCRFGAISEDLVIDPVACEGCGVCVWFCPEEALKLKEKEVGQVFWAETPYGPLIYATLYPGEENSGKLVAEVKKKARELAEKEGQRLILVDGSPGVGCPVIASLSGAEAVILVAEPTVSGLHDLSRVASLIKHFQLKAWLIVNKADLNPEMAQRLKSEAQRLELGFLGEIPYDPQVFEAIHQGQPLPAVSSGAATEALEEIYQQLKKEVFA